MCSGEAAAAGGSLDLNDRDTFPNWELPTARDDGVDDVLGRFRGVTRQKQKTCNSEDSGDCHSAQVDDSVYVAAAEPSEGFETEMLKAPRLSPLRKPGLDCGAAADCDVPHQANEDTLA